MVEESELEGFRRDRYFARSWALLTRDRGWIKPVLVMTAAALVPFVGWLGVIGYVQEWARLTAWGVNAAPKQKGVRVGECIKSGWRAFVVILVWSLVNAVVAAVLSAVPLFGGLLGFAWTIFGIFVNLMVMVAVLRATIYQKIKAGLRVKTVWEMASHDVGGLARVLGILAVGGAILAVITFVVLFSVLFSAIPQLIYMVDYVTRYEAILSSSMQAAFALNIIFSFLSAIGPALVVLYLISCFFGIVLSMLGFTAIGLWMRQFDVSAWGREEDPLPPFVGDPRDASSWQPERPAATAPSPAAAEPAPETQAEVVEVVTVAAAPDAAGPAPEVEPTPAEPEPAPAPAPEPAAVEDAEPEGPVVSHDVPEPDEGPISGHDDEGEKN